jgi:hypothetical protein
MMCNTAPDKLVATLKHISQKEDTVVKMTLLLINMLGLSLALSACGSAKLEIQALSPAEATAEAIGLAGDGPQIGQGQQTGWMSYTNERYGLTFEYPETWALEENQNAATLRRDGVLVTVGFKLTGEPGSLQGELPAGELIPGDPATSLFLGQEVSRMILEKDGQTKAVLYGEQRELSNMAFAARAELEASAVDTGGITAELQTEIDQIVASIDLNWVALPLPETAMEGWETYVNDDYGFSLRYPPTWTLEVVPGNGQMGPGGSLQGDAVTLTKDITLLYIGFKRADEDLFIGWTGVGGTAMQKGDPIFAVIAGQEVPRVHVMYEELLKTILYGASGAPALEIGDMDFAIRLDDTAQQEAFYESELSQEVRDEADDIITSLTLAPR